MQIWNGAFQDFTSQVSISGRHPDAGRQRGRFELGAIPDSGILQGT